MNNRLHWPKAIRGGHNGTEEHRLFCYISKNWQGQPLIDIETVVNLIGSTTTEKGLTVKCIVDPNYYEPGTKITDEQKEALNIEFVGPNQK